MTTFFNLNNFISGFVTKREKSLLTADFLKYDEELNKRITGKSLLVIGGAGTIGSAYIKALLKFRIEKLVVVDINVNGLVELERELRHSPEYHFPEHFTSYTFNFGDRVFEDIFLYHGPFDIVAHFAGIKHLANENDICSIGTLIENNVLRTHKLLSLLVESPPKHFFCVSTGRAVNPHNISEATVKFMEEMLMAYSVLLPVNTARVTDVAFSNGSILYGFLERFKKMQAWFCPSGIRRFFVSPQESGELCLMASIMGEPGDIFFPKLDEDRDMIPFDQIALDLLKELGFEADICASEDEAKQKALALSPILQFSQFPTSPLTQSPILPVSQSLSRPVAWPVYFFGSDTSGEKSFEEFFTENEELDNDSFINLGVVKNSKKCSIEKIDEIVARLQELFNQTSITKTELMEILNSIEHSLPRVSGDDTDAAACSDFSADEHGRE